MNCLFCKLVNGEIPASLLFEDNQIMAFQDINPQAPTHILIIPKRHIATINDAEENDTDLMGTLILRAKKLALNLGISEEGYRLVFNVNSGGGQEVYHLHLHLLGGRQMSWPPG
ncbi:MAG: histidine triad nucleotide-binding protein [bacterium]|nr:histidine triad nucleotide-binding protein [bacterium]